MQAGWNFYIENAGPQGTILFPRPVVVNSIRVSSEGSTTFTLSSAGNPDVSLTTSGNNPATLVTGWTNPVTSLTVRASTSDQVFDDLRLTTSAGGGGGFLGKAGHALVIAPKSEQLVSPGGLTDYLFTGQKYEEQLGLYWYGSRWYDPYLNRWTSPDPIIPDPYNTLDWDRYSYVQNRPTVLVDPSGHSATKFLTMDADFTGPELFGIKFTGNWTLGGMLSVMEAVRSVADRFAESTRGRSSDAFSAVYNTSTTNPLVFEMGCPECSRLGLTVNTHHIKIRDFYSIAYADKALRDRNMITHELGHAFNAQMVNDLGATLSPSQVLNQKQSVDPNYPNRIAVEGYFYGFASVSGVYTWQQSTDPHYSEEFADQFLGWTYDTWQLGPNGQARATFMNINMYMWVSATGY